jgi:DNA polymerase-3 subunit epsilon
VIKASEAELAEHENYLAALDKSVGGECTWRKIDAPMAAA